MIYDNVKKVCAEKGISISKLEEELGFARGSMCKWNDNIPSVFKAKQAADYLGLTVDELLADEVAG